MTTSEYDDRAAWAWAELEAEFQDAGVVPVLPGPTSAHFVQRVEEVTGFRLPASLEAVYLIHDGCGLPASASNGMFASSFLISIAEALEMYLYMKAALRADWKEYWLPISSRPSGDMFYADLHTGRIYEFRHDEVGAARFRRTCEDVCEYLTDHVSPDEVEWS